MRRTVLAITALSLASAVGTALATDVGGAIKTNADICNVEVNTQMSCHDVCIWDQNDPIICVPGHWPPP